MKYLEIKNISKQFAGAKALNNVSLEVYTGEVLALLGVNGAGKSTLMNVLGGIIQPDTGEILINGKQVKIENPKQAKELGIAFIQQEIQIFENLSVFENIFITELKKWNVGKIVPFFSTSKLKGEAQKYLDMLGLHISVGTKMSRLSVGEQQMVQIARALSQGGKILLFDEPTSSLTDTEKTKLFDTIHKLRQSGMVIIYITHYLDEVFTICDKAAILRDGELSGKGNISELNKEQITQYMLGSSLKAKIEKRNYRESEIVLDVKNLSGKSKPYNISFQLHRGEILGVWGLLGSGRTELIRNLLALNKPTQGEMYYIAGSGRKKIHGKFLRKKSAYLTEGRHYDGLFLDMPLWINATVTNMKIFSSRLFKILDTEKERKETLKYMKDINVMAVDEKMYAKNLSGGNQQKLILAKWFMKDPEIFFLDEPTKGVDVGAKMEIQNLIFKYANKGKSFVVISSEFEEIMSLCDKIIVMNNGKLVAEVKKEDFSKESLMSGIVEGEA